MEWHPQRSAPGLPSRETNSQCDIFTQTQSSLFFPPSFRFFFLLTVSTLFFPRPTPFHWSSQRSWQLDRIRHEIHGGSKRFRFSCLLIATSELESENFLTLHKINCGYMLSPASVGKAIVDHHAYLLGSDLSVARVHEAHTLVKASLDAVAPELKLYTFGSSSVYGFHETKSDVDFVALRPEDIVDGKGGDSTSQIAKGLQTQALAKLAKAVRQNNVQWSVEEVRRARVPVVRVKAPHIDFDITAHRRNGVRNSALLHHYLAQRPENRWLSIAIKGWSKRTGMNGAMGYLTSYGFNIMVAYYLLHRHRSLTKPASATTSQLGDSPAPQTSTSANIDAAALLKFLDKDELDVSRIQPIPEYLPLQPPNAEELGGQVLDFLDFYLSRFPMDTHVISLSHEQPITKESLNWTRTAEDMKNMSSEKIFYRLCIEDPYEVNLNVGRNVSPFKFDLMKKHFEKGASTALGLL